MKVTRPAQFKRGVGIPPRMGRGPLAFTLVFVILPILGFLGAWFLGGGTAVALAVASLMLLGLGFTVGLFLLE